MALVSLRRWYVTIACVHANKFHSFNFYLLFESDECFCVKATRHTAKLLLRNCIEIMVWHAAWYQSPGWMPACRLLPVVVDTEHDTIYIYWMLDGEFVRDDTHTHTHMTEGARERERKLACNINQIIYRKLWYSVSSSTRLGTACTHARPFCT